MVKVVLYFLILLGLAQLFLLISLKIGYDFLPVSAQDFLKNQQEFNSKLQEGFITNTLSGFLFNLLLLAVIPAIGEELFFRGILQNICVGLFRNRIVGVLITSLIFGLLHFKIENLLSIIFASVLLGLVYEYSNNILITIILHFGFNSFSLCCMQALKSGYLNDNQLDLMGNYLFIPLGVAISVYVIVKKKYFGKKNYFSLLTE